MSKPNVEYTIGVAWVPGLGEWVDNEYDYQVTAHQDAQAAVAAAIGEVDP